MRYLLPRDLPDAELVDGRSHRGTRRDALAAQAGCVRNGDKFIAARGLFIRLHEEASWNPWVIDDRAQGLNKAMAVMDQWRRAEPNHRYLTKKQLDARLARVQRETRARHAAANRRREADRQRYDPDREAARLALLERQSRLAYELPEVAELRAGVRFPAMDDKRRADQVADLDSSIADNRREIQRLTVIVGDPEDVVDERGWLPADRRELMLSLFSAERSVEVRQLRGALPDLTAAAQAATDKTDRAERRGALRDARRSLETLLAIPPLTAEDMCSECATPARRHGWNTPPTEGPCPAWPRWAACIQHAREMLLRFSRESRALEPPQLKPQPLAVIPSGLSIPEVLTRLQEIQQMYPHAEVRRGRANRWEIWPATAASLEARA